MNPEKRIRIDSFLFEFKRWAATESEIWAVGLLGPPVGDTTEDESSVDLFVIVELPNKFLEFRQWTSLFGEVDRDQMKSDGPCPSLHVWYRDGLEVDFGFCDETWSRLRLDERTREIMSRGMKVLFERSPMSTRLGSGSV